jgi:5-methylcytosine-specific restriction protein B
VPVGSETSRPSRIPMDRLLRLVRKTYPDWQGFEHPGFNAEEVAYKQKTVGYVREVLGKDTLRHLLETNRLDQFLNYFEDACKHNNLLYRNSPKTGDYAILYAEGLEKRSFCEALFGLLHGEGESPVRLERYLVYVREHRLPNRWAFPTYLLFFSDPENDYFVKPTVTRWFLDLIGAKDLYSAAPSGEAYAAILGLVKQAQSELGQFGVRDMIDVQSFLFVAHSAITRDPDRQRVWKIAPGESGWHWKECLEGGFIGIGWEELGDMSQLNRDEFEIRRDQLARERQDYNAEGMEQAWKFAHILTGDKIVANEGTRKILGIGTVSGPYYYVPGATYGHRLPVHWEDTTPHTVEKPGWRRTLIELDPYELDRLVPPHQAEPVNPAFQPEAFQLLAGLQENPSKAYYQEHRERFQTLVEEPFHRLFREVVHRLPDAILNTMEIERQVFGRILKNDYGRGGAWPFYWGALYPKGGNKTRDPQLSLWVNHDFLKASFYMGEYGAEKRALFLRNCALYKDSLRGLIGNEISDPKFIFGLKSRWTDPATGSFTRRPEVSWDNWLSNPAEAGIDAGVVFLRAEIGSMDLGELADEVAAVFQQVFPLVLLSVLDDPLPAIQKYLDAETIEDSINLPYPLPDCADTTGFSEGALERWVRAIRRKKQAIFYGPPGTGKTHIARELARHLIGGGTGFEELVQFHPSYSYEEFIQGIRPEPIPGGGLDYPLKKGRFLEFCDRAREVGDSPCVLIIDEINRAHLSRVFGELMYLLEYRDKAIPLAAGRSFSIPDNVYILGTMNTADRSIALVDHALRRRFAFIGVQPNMDILRRKHTGFGWVEPLIEILEEVNREIANPHYEVGVTFFLGENVRSEIEDIWEMEIYPYLEEYFFDQPSRAEKFSWSNIRGRLGS